MGFTDFHCSAHGGKARVHCDNPDRDLIVEVGICAPCLNLLGSLDPDEHEGAA